MKIRIVPVGRRRCVGEIEVVEAEGTGCVDVGGPGRVGGFCDGDCR